MKGKMKYSLLAVSLVLISTLGIFFYKNHSGKKWVEENWNNDRALEVDDVNKIKELFSLIINQIKNIIIFNLYK